MAREADKAEGALRGHKCRAGPRAPSGGGGAGGRDGRVQHVGAGPDAPSSPAALNHPRRREQGGREALIASWSATRRAPPAATASGTSRVALAGESRRPAVRTRAHAAEKCAGVDAEA